MDVKLLVYPHRINRPNEKTEGVQYPLIAMWSSKRAHKYQSRDSSQHIIKRFNTRKLVEDFFLEPSEGTASHQCGAANKLTNISLVIVIST
eukprot:6187780-Pleurochrysis_carterae.AAC.1